MRSFLKSCFITIFCFAVMAGCAAQMYTAGMASVKENLIRNGSFSTGPMEKAVFDGSGRVKFNAGLVELLELGAIYPLQKRYDLSNQVLESAFHRYTMLEERARISVRNTTTDMLDIILAEGAGEYDMVPWEKIFLHTIKAMNFLMLERIDAARVEIMRGINQNLRIRENAELKIAEVRKSKNLVRQEAGKNNIQNIDVDRQVRQLTQKNGLSSAQEQAVRNLRSSYENAYTYLLSALVFALTSEPENARPQLKNASALTDNPYVKMLYDNFQKDPSSLTSRHNVYVFIQTGFAPTKRNIQVPFFNPVSRTVSSFSLAAINESPLDIFAVEIFDTVSGGAKRMPLLADLDLLALRQYQDDLPVRITKAVLRVILQTLKDRAILDETAKKTKDTTLVQLTQIALSTFNQTVNKSDLRAWNMAPRNVYFYCSATKDKTLMLKVSDRSGHVVQQQVSIDPNRVNIVWARCIGPRVYVNTSALNASESWTY